MYDAAEMPIILLMGDPDGNEEAPEIDEVATPLAEDEDDDEDDEDEDTVADADDDEDGDEEGDEEDDE